MIRKSSVIWAFSLNPYYSNPPQNQYFRHLLVCRPRKATALLRSPHQNLLKNIWFSGRRILRLPKISLNKPKTQVILSDYRVFWWSSREFLYLKIGVRIVLQWLAIGVLSEPASKSVFSASFGLSSSKGDSLTSSSAPKSSQKYLIFRSQNFKITKNFFE